jgi:hypothetical protein
MPNSQWRPVTLLGTLALLASCTELVTLPAGSESFEPPPEYQLWWNMTESCSGLRGSLDAVEWYVVPGAAVLPGTNGEFSGEWFAQGNRIVLADSERLDGGLVRHEMLHALIRGAGHPRREFLEQCAGYVFCAYECTKDGGPAPVPPAGTPLVSPDSLQIGIELQPAPLNTSNFGGYFTFLITAHNAASHAVIADLSSPPGLPGVSFSYVLTTDTHLLTGTNFTFAYDSEDTYFRAGETKRAVFDVFVGDYRQGGLGPGSYAAYGYFGSALSASPAVFAISP